MVLGDYHAATEQRLGRLPRRYERLGRLPRRYERRRLHLRFQRGRALGNRGRGFQLGPETTSHGLHAEDEGRARHRFYNLSWATTAAPLLRGVRNVTINTRWRRLLRGRKFFTGKGQRHPSVRRVHPAEIDYVRRFSPMCFDRAFMIIIS